MTTYLIDTPIVPDVRVKTDAAFPIVLAGLFVLVYVQGYLERVGVSTRVVKVLIEGPVLLILVHLVNRGIRHLSPGSLMVALYAVWAVASAVFNGDRVFMAFVYVRYVLYAYIVFVAVWATPLTKAAVVRINAIIISLFLFQILASAHEVFVQGERVESHVGTLFATGGALATEFPLLAMGLTVPFYLLWRANLLLLVLSWGFFLVGYASGKRAIYFLGPALYISILGWYGIRVRTPQALRRLAGGVVVFLCLSPFLLLGISKSHGISDSHWKHPLERITYALNAATQYTTAEGQAGRTTGRTATSRRVLATLWNENRETVLFGWGPSSARIGEAERYEKLMITYGICGWAQDAICIGWPGMLIYVLFQLRMFFCLRSCDLQRYSGYWMAIRFGAEIGFFVIMLSYVGYSSSVITGGHLSYVYFYLLALLTSPQHRHIVQHAS